MIGSDSYKRFMRYHNAIQDYIHDNGSLEELQKAAAEYFGTTDVATPLQVQTNRPPELNALNHPASTQEELPSCQNAEETLKLINEQTGNIVYKKAAERFGFKIVEIEGKVFSTSRELARAFGYYDTSAILRYLKENGLEPLDIDRFVLTTQNYIRKAFDLHPKDYKTKLLGWKCFMTISISNREVSRRLLNIFLEMTGEKGGDRTMQKTSKPESSPTSIATPETDSFALPPEAPGNDLTAILNKEALSDQDINQILELIDEQTANIAYKMAAEYFGFKIIEVEGKVFSTSKELSRALDYCDTSTILWYLRQHTLKPLDIKSFRNSSQSLIRQIFNLSPHDYSTKLLDWKCFIAIGVKKKEVCQYLLYAERKTRVDTAIYQATGLNANDFADIYPYIDDPIVGLSKSLMETRIEQLKQNRKIEKIERRLQKQEKAHTLLKARMEATEKSSEEILGDTIIGSLCRVTNQQLKEVNKHISEVARKDAEEAPPPCRTDRLTARLKRALQGIVRKHFLVKSLRNLDQRDLEEVHSLLKFLHMNQEERNSIEGRMLKERLEALAEARLERMKKSRMVELLLGYRPETTMEAIDKWLKRSSQPPRNEHQNS